MFSQQPTFFYIRFGFSQCQQIIFSQKFDYGSIRYIKMIGGIISVKKRFLCLIISLYPLFIIQVINREIIDISLFVQQIRIFYSSHIFGYSLFSIFVCSLFMSVFQIIICNLRLFNYAVNGFFTHYIQIDLDIWDMS